MIWTSHDSASLWLWFVTQGYGGDSRQYHRREGTVYQRVQCSDGTTHCRAKGNGQFSVFPSHIFFSFPSHRLKVFDQYGPEQGSRAACQSSHNRSVFTTEDWASTKLFVRRTSSPSLVTRVMYVVFARSVACYVCMDSHRLPSTILAW